MSQDNKTDQTDKGPLSQSLWRPGRVLSLLLLCFLLFEGACQIFIYRWTGKRYQTFSLYRWSPYGLVRNNPKLTSPSFQISKNEFRNIKEFTQTKPPNTIRILCLGGSVFYSGFGGYVIPGTKRISSSHTIAQYLGKELRRDPKLKGIRIESINASVNFNRIVEISSAYISQYAFWNPDFVIVGGSGNNFLGQPSNEDILKREYNIMAPHPWEKEFQRVNNRHNISALLEHTYTTLSSYSAAFGILKKLATYTVDRSFAKSEQYRFVKTPEKQAKYAGKKMLDLYFKEYEGYVDAMISVARKHNQVPAFFWEYHIGEMNGIKPFTAREKILYAHNGKGLSRDSKRHLFIMHDKFMKYMKRRKIIAIDPLPELKTYKKDVFIDYLHYAKEGNELMAKVTYDRIRHLVHQRADQLRQRAQTSTKPQPALPQIKPKRAPAPTPATPKGPSTKPTSQHSLQRPR